MEPIKLYFAGVWPSSQDSDLGITNRLLTYAYPAEIDVWARQNGDTPGSLLIDSGAFSAWNKGKHIDLPKYIEFVHKTTDKFTTLNKEVRAVNLDVIPGSVGKTASLNAIYGSLATINANKQVIEEAAKEGYRNLKIMKSEGITPIHVYHQGEDIKWLHRMVEQTDYIGVSPANDMPTNSKKRWITSIFEYMYKEGITVKTHGFAVWILDIMKDLPWTSCDASTWLLMAARGAIRVPLKGFGTGFTPESVVMAISDKSTPKGHGLSTPLILRTLEEQGYPYESLQQWQVRAVYNARYYMRLEQWLNEYKKTRAFPILARKGLIN